MNCAVGYYAQHVSAALHAEHTVLQAMSEEAQPDITRQEILNLAGSLLFSGDDVQKKVRVLSGGEKSRVALGRILLKRAPCLLLDEPTNHLDFNTVEALTQALANYSGTVVVVSHDRGFVRRVANQILEIRDGSVDLYPGTYDEYVWSLQRGFFSEKVTTPTDRVTRSVQPIVERAENSKERRKTLDKRIRNLEKEVLRGEALVAELESTLAQLSEKLSSVAGASAQSLVLEIQVQQKRLEQVESEWFAKLEEKEQCLKELEQLSAGAP
jgi:ATP-binding cassette subfamily F protein 3